MGLGRDVILSFMSSVWYSVVRSYGYTAAMIARWLAMFSSKEVDASYFAAAFTAVMLLGLMDSTSCL